ncbi:dockerin type I domain-containing protein [Pseudoflavonifractor phocaeensis]|uniref:dockerin type I domain-containing protein n=1 Tax=Pseudoflavonifractor phocaeensis TaxID=1870988 RepID=UPI001F1C5BCA|nr:dockerin type I domain-containing protein [Pseudoflavonifractor phocaeensis]MCF2595151.1 Cna B-type domain-containing protein [Pseudoflavonifractor phocaeensis]
MRKKARWLTSVMLTAAMVMSCLPIASAKTYTPPSAQGSANSNPWGINVDLSGVPAQVQATVANMIAQGEEPMEKQTDALLAKLVERASGISLEAVKTSLGLELLQNDMGTFDTSRFNLTESQFNRVMREVLADYYLGDVAYECEVVDGKVTGINYVPKSEASDAMITAAMLAEDDEESVSSQTMAASFSLNNEDAAVLSDEDDVDENTQDITVKVNWKDNNKTANRPDTVTLILIGKTENSDQDTSEYYDQDDPYYYEYKFEFDKKTPSKTISVPKYDEADNEITYTVSENGIENGGTLNGKKGATYTVTYDQANYTVTNTADGESGTEYDVYFDWQRDDKFVDADGNIVGKENAAMTLIYDSETKTIGYGEKSVIDFKLVSVTLTPKDGDGSEKIVLEPTEENGVDYETMYAFGEHESLNRADFGKNADYASTIKYATYDCKYGTFEDRKDVTACAEQIHWNQMLTFTGDFAQHFGAAGDFWTSKNTKDTPYGAFKTQIDSYPEDYIPDAVMDHTMEMMTLAYMSYEKDYGSLLDEKIKDCLDQLDEKMTPVQKYLVIHDWIANNAEFDMGVLVKTAAGTGNPDPAQMTAFGTLLSDAMGYDGCVCLGYAATFAVLVQQAFPEIYQNEDGTWKTASEVKDKDIVDLVQIRFYADLAEFSVAGADSGFGKADEMFGSAHYYNAVKVGSKWYCIDSAYDDISTEVMDQCRVETKGNISHKYFMISPVNMLGMFEDSMDYIDCRYDGVVFLRTLNTDEEGNVIVDANGNPYKTEKDKYGNEHVYWTKYNVEDVGMKELECDDEQYEATWFSGAVGEITHDDNYWYYITGPSFSYANMMNMMNQMKDQGKDLGELMEQMRGESNNSEKDRLVRRPRTAVDEPKETEETEEEESGSSGGTGGMSSYDDPHDEILFHFGYGSVLPDEEVLDNKDISEDKKQGPYYDQVLLDETYYDMYPDLVHSMGMYDGVLYFNLGNKIYTMTGADKVTSAEEKLTLEDVAIAQLKEYNDVYAKTDGRDFTGMSFYAVSKADYNAEGAENNAFHVFNRPIAAICIEDEVIYREDPIMGGPDGETVVGKTTVRDGDPVPTLTVSIGTNFSESNKGRKDDDGNYVYGPYEPYTLEAVDYNPDYSKYTDDGSDPDVNDNEEFMWCANVVDTMPMDAMLEELASEENTEDAEAVENASEGTEDDKYVTVTVRAWCGQDGYTEQRTKTYGLSDGTAKVTNENDLAQNHHYIDNELEECYVCVHCNTSYHEEYEDGDDGYKPYDKDATYEHYDYDEGETPEFVNIEWAADYSTCTAQLKCAERYCDAAIYDTFNCTVKDEEIAGSDGNTYRVCTATYMGNVVDKQYPNGKPAYTLGDVNDDGEIKLKDVVLLRQYYAGGDVTVNELAADVNGDGSVTLKDVVLLRQYYAGWDVQLGKSEDAE